MMEIVGNVFLRILVPAGCIGTAALLAVGLFNGPFDLGLTIITIGGLVLGIVLAIVLNTPRAWRRGMQYSSRAAERRARDEPN